MEIDQLRYLVQVVRSGGFTRAAGVVHVQQPAVSRGIKQLEEELGVVLLERGKRHVTPTAIGREVLAACNDVLVAVENVRRICEADRDDVRGVLKFGAASAISCGLVPDVNAAFRQTHPDVWPMTFTGSTQPILESIASGNLELGLLFHAPHALREIQVRTLARIPFRLVVRTQDRRNRAVLASFIGSREVEDEGTRKYPTVDRIRKDIPDVRIRISSNDSAAHLEMVRRGLGVAILPEFFVAGDLARGTIADVYPKERFAFDVLLATRRLHILSRMAEKYLDAVVAQLRPRAGRTTLRRARRSQRSRP